MASGKPAGAWPCLISFLDRRTNVERVSQRDLFPEGVGDDCRKERRSQRPPGRNDNVEEGGAEPACYSVDACRNLCGGSLHIGMAGPIKPTPTIIIPCQRSGGPDGAGHHSQGVQRQAAAPLPWGLETPRSPAVA